MLEIDLLQEPENWTDIRQGAWINLATALGHETALGGACEEQKHVEVWLRKVSLRVMCLNAWFPDDGAV